MELVEVCVAHPPRGAKIASRGPFAGAREFSVDRFSATACVATRACRSAKIVRARACPRRGNPEVEGLQPSAAISDTSLHLHQPLNLTTYILY